MSVPLQFTPDLEIGKPIVLFVDPRLWSGYQVLSDGRLLVAREVDSARQTQINVIMNWTKELEGK